MLYFDHNATSPLCEEAREAWLRTTADIVGNPSSQHRAGARAERALNEARECVAALVGCQPEEIVWTSGATEALNTALSQFTAGSVSSVEHPCVLAAAKRAFSSTHLLPVHATGVMDLEALRHLLREHRPPLVAVMAANNETGVLQPWRKALALCREAGVPMLCDAAQWLGKLPPAGLGACSYLAGCGHKFGGPMGIGFLKVTGRLKPSLIGGPQESGRRAGTENVPGAVAFAAALAARQRDLGDRLLYRARFVRSVLSTIPGSRLLGDGAECLWNTVSLLLPSLAGGQRWLVKLDKLGVAASSGSACASGQEAPSHVLAAMGLNPEESQRVVRFSSGWETTSLEWQNLAAKICQLWAGLLPESPMGGNVRIAADSDA